MDDIPIPPHVEPPGLDYAQPELAAALLAEARRLRLGAGAAASVAGLVILAIGATVAVLSTLGVI